MTRTLLATLVLVCCAATAASAAPANDDCAAATVVIPGTDFEETIDTTTATTAVDDPLQTCTTAGPNQNARTIWYQFTAPADGILSVYTMNTAFPADPPTIVSVHSGICGALAEIACDDSTTPITSYLHTDVSAGVTYTIDVANEAGSAGGLVAVRIYFDPDSPICSHDAGAFHYGKSTLTFSTPPAPADARVQLTARVTLQAALGDVGAAGLQMLVEDDHDAYTPIVEWSARTLAVPPGGPGTGCGPKDGWTASASGTSQHYRNGSNALPPACVPGSANGLTDVRLHRRPPDGREVDVKVKTRGTTFAQALAGLTSARVAITFEAGIGATNADRCAVSFFPFACQSKSGGSKLVCKAF